jgi:hypothetical protein
MDDFQFLKKNRYQILAEISNKYFFQRLQMLEQYGANLLI